MVKGVKRNRSRPSRGRKKVAVSPPEGAAEASDLPCVVWTSEKLSPGHKITGILHHITLDHNYIFNCPVTIAGFNIPAPKTSSNHFEVGLLSTLFNINCRTCIRSIHIGSIGTDASLRVSLNRVNQPDQRPALKPAKKSQKNEVPNNNKSIKDYFPVRRSYRKTLVKMKKERLKDIEEAIISGTEDGYKVHNFEGKGRGVVTLKSLKQGDFVLEYYGDLITREEAKMREFLYSQDENVGCYMYYFNYNNKAFCVDATRETGRLGRLVNHCKKGNLGTKIFLVQERPRLILVAKQDINAGEELSYDYGDRSKKSLECHPWLAT